MPAVCLRLSCDQRCVLVEVWDDSVTAPARKSPRLDDESGRGLMLVEALSDRWGWYVPHGPGGKVVWAEVHYSSGGVRAAAKLDDHGAVLR